MLAVIEWFAKPEYMDAVAAVADGMKSKVGLTGPEVEEITRSTGLEPLSIEKQPKVHCK